MEQSVRDEILTKLKAAPKAAFPARPHLPPYKTLSMDREQLIAEFITRLTEEAVVVHRAKDFPEALEKLTVVALEEGLKKVMATADDVVLRLDLPAWGKKNDIQIMTPRDFPDRESYRDAVFDQAQAGITGVDFAVAESATIGLIHNQDQARLVSLAPILHIAIVPVDRLVPVYEQVIEKVFGNKKQCPSQFVFISGPSMTGDIQGVLFKGMHGPRKVIVILVG
ncbi:MAG: lactate utilization protein [Thermodesulfobacteriota bacterium]|nr:lactate utilization protein [Thermodesulfobacteriota bacterium]